MNDQNGKKTWLQKKFQKIKIFYHFSLIRLENNSLHGTPDLLSAMLMATFSL